MVDLWVDFLYFWYFPDFLQWSSSTFIIKKRNKGFKIVSILNLTKKHTLIFAEDWRLYYRKDDQVMRTMSHSFIHFIYLYLLLLPQNRFSPAYKKPVIGLAGLNGVKLEKLLFSWPHCVSNLLTGPASLGLDYIVGEPLTFPVTGVVNELSRSPMFMSVNESLQKKGGFLSVYSGTPSIYSLQNRLFYKLLNDICTCCGSTKIC